MDKSFSDSKSDNVSFKLYIVENQIIEALKIWLENYKVNYKVKDISNTENNKLIEKYIVFTKKELENKMLSLAKSMTF